VPEQQWKHSAAGGVRRANWDYRYDACNRLWWPKQKVAGASKWHQQFLLDPFGNRRLLNDSGTLIPNQMMTPRGGLLSDPNPFNGRTTSGRGGVLSEWGPEDGVGERDRHRVDEVLGDRILRCFKPATRASHIGKFNRHIFSSGAGQTRVSS
jgi:hypothetical protein